MPYQDSWVEHWLVRYCAPGKHRFRQLRPDVIICERCFKEELTEGASCLICGLPGAVTATLRRSRGHSSGQTGRLCGPCFDEFGERHSIGGWMIALAS